ncbi:1-acyl-sn-glycerol-3-phosphate acyltransferase [Chitinimonas arctica]|uniref:1-acyl-sn-glycerol-3-phosphate acyltransferase n=1 Tax=Chitinimonas arctica TaxID=2594795 RepID=A0A516SG87_9NEIS|nr:lysophospholipid acyltransferase family protein [Chitinimonas arctica]QDQ27171.1 1-acyl-sn-glycerol-3-phosphate acyltransferase [Chitinimonas arctica]
MGVFTQIELPAMRIIQAIYSIYVGLMFTLGLAAVVPFYLPAFLLDERRRLTVMYAVNRVSMRVWSLLTGIRVRIEGQAAWQPAPVIIGNHCNVLDMPVCAIACAQPVKVLAKQEFARIPLLGFIIKSFAVLVTRDSPESRQRSIAILSAALGRGWPVFIFPEGTRNRGATPLQPFRDGPFRFAIAAQAPIQPFVQLNMRGVQSPNTLMLRPGRVIFRWLPPIPTTGLTEADLPALRDKVYALIEAQLRRDDPAFAG